MCQRCAHNCHLCRYTPHCCLPHLFVIPLHSGCEDAHPGGRVYMPHPQSWLLRCPHEGGWGGGGVRNERNPVHLLRQKHPRHCCRRICPNHRFIVTPLRVAPPPSIPSTTNSIYTLTLSSLRQYPSHPACMFVCTAPKRKIFVPSTTYNGANYIRNPCMDCINLNFYYLHILGLSCSQIV